MIDSYNQKTIITGNMIQHKTYPFSIFTGRKSKRDDYSRTKKDKTSLSLSRTRTNLVNTINSNLTRYTKLLTLTTADIIQSRDDMSYYLKQFAKRFKRAYGFNLPYIAVLETQKRGRFCDIQTKQEKHGALHFHIVIFLDQYIPFQDINKFWDYGATNIKQLKNGASDVARYLAKYITKDSEMIKSITDFNQKIIFKSRNLKKPEVYNGESPDSLGLASLKPTYSYKQTLPQYKCLWYPNIPQEEQLPAQIQVIEYRQT